MLYRIKGTVSTKVKMLHESNSVDEKGNWVYVDKKIYYIEADGFQKASVKAKKILDHVHQVSQISGEFVDV